jgi:hypothetical protein
MRACELDMDAQTPAEDRGLDDDYDLLTVVRYDPNVWGVPHSLRVEGCSPVQRCMPDSRPHLHARTAQRMVRRLLSAVKT